MRIRNCDRCGKEIPMIPDFMNSPEIMNPKLGTIVEIYSPTTLRRYYTVDLCNNCKEAVYDFIFQNSR